MSLSGLVVLRQLLLQMHLCASATSASSRIFRGVCVSSEREDQDGRGYLGKEEEEEEQQRQDDSGMNPGTMGVQYNAITRPE